MGNILLDLQLCIEDDALPSQAQFEKWASKALLSESDMEMTVRVVDAEESQQLNNEYRDKDKPTNVLSFPFEAPEFVDIDLLGDLVICAPVVQAEAVEQNKRLESHWAHMIIHGTLHLQGYDHINDTDAEKMESLEIKILNELGYNNPYIEEAQ